MTDRTEHYGGISLGEERNVHGYGFGVVVEIRLADNPLDDRVTVEVKRACRCSCGNDHEDVRVHWRHPINTSRVGV